MFEMQSKKSGRISIASKNNSTSRSKLAKKEMVSAKQKIILDIINTDGNFKQKKSKSQCLSNQRKHDKKSIDVCKFMETTRSAKSKKSREKTQKATRPFQQLHTQDKGKHQSYLISNLPTQKSAELKWTKKNSLKKASQGRSAEKKKCTWNEKLVPLDWQYTLDHYSQYLTKYQQSQIKEYKKIYYVGHKAQKREKIDNSNPAFDTQEKEYKYIENDHIAYRYQILSLIGKGSYGQVFKALDHKTREEVALKIIKNQPKFSKQAFIEIKILSHIKKCDEEKQSNVVVIKDFVIFRNHVCIIFELLSQNLYQLIIRNNYNGLNEELIRRFAIQILVSLEFLRNNNIIHCDLKPENILLKEYNKSGIKIIDFGSSCLESETLYTYIQSRYYRAPEITLGIPYSHYIDIWSTGCILAELYTGVPVFPGQNEYEQMKYMTDSLNLPPKSLILRGSRRSVFFDEDYKLRPQIQSLGSTLEMFSKPLRERIEDSDFLSFIQSFLKWVPEDRVTPVEALGHNWIRKGLPEELKNKLSASNKLIKHATTITKNDSSKRVKTKSRQKGASLVKISNKLSYQRLKKGSLGLKF